MAALAAAPATVPRVVVSVERLRGALLWLMGLGGAFAFIEPGPYEFIGVIAIGLCALMGIALRRAAVPLVLLLIILNVGYALAVVQVMDEPKRVIWVLVSIFLAVTALFYASILGANTQARLDTLLRGYLCGALIASLIAIGAYFRLFGGASDMFLLFGRARGTFNDPNVLGAFLILPCLLLLQRILQGRLSALLGSGALLLVLSAALFLSFSRAAWGQLVFAGLFLMATTFVTSRSPAERFRIVSIAMFGAIAVTVLVAALLSIGDVADLFKQRASLEQSYDLGPMGRFSRYLLGFQIMLDKPLGIGPLSFAAHYFPEDPHNTFLNSFMSGGWLGGLSYLTLTLVTAVAGLRYIPARTPWRHTYQAVYAAYLGVVAESAIIDIDHWRHYFLILGVLWGLMAVSRPYLARAPAPA